MDVGGNGSMLAQRYPGEVWKFMLIWLWVYGPLMSSPETVCTDDDWGLWRGSWDGFDIGAYHYKSRFFFFLKHLYSRYGRSYIMPPDPGLTKVLYRMPKLRPQTIKGVTFVITLPV